MSKPRLVSAIIRCRCSYCRQGRVFNSFWRMNRLCPHCGIQFEREPGYFLMSIFVGYVLHFIILGPIALFIYFQDLMQMNVIIFLGILVILIEPWVFRYSRVLWLHVDELLDPRPNISSSETTNQ